MHPVAERSSTVVRDLSSCGAANSFPRCRTINGFELGGGRAPYDVKEIVVEQPKSVSSPYFSV